MASVNGERLDTIYGVGMPHDEALGMVGRQLRLEGQLQDGATLELVSVSKSGKGEAAAGSAKPESNDGQRGGEGAGGRALGLERVAPLAQR